MILLYKPEDAVLTVREYVQYLHELFADYNLTANREHRVDAHMRAAGVYPSPAGLWRWGHEMGVGFRRHTDDADLITGLLPSNEARVRRNAIYYAGCDYMSDEIKAAEWTAIARNFGGWNVPINYYPGSMGSIWTPNAGSSGLLQLRITDESRASAELTSEEWADVIAAATMDRPMEEHLRMMNSIESGQRIEALLKNAKRLTAEAVAKASGTAPTMTEARIIETTTTHPSKSEKRVQEEARDEAMDTHQAMLDAVLRSGSFAEFAS